MNVQTKPSADGQAFHENLFHCIDGENWAALSEFFCSDCIYERPGYDPIKGIQNLRHFYQHERIIRAGKHTVERMANDDGVIFCEGFFRGVAKDGSELSERFVDRYVLQGDKIGHRQTYFYRSAI